MSNQCKQHVNIADPDITFVNEPDATVELEPITLIWLVGGQKQTEKFTGEPATRTDMGRRWSMAYRRPEQRQWDISRRCARTTGDAVTQVHLTAWRRRAENLDQGSRRLDWCVGP